MDEEAKRRSMEQGRAHLALTPPADEKMLIDASSRTVLLGRICARAELLTLKDIGSQGRIYVWRSSKGGGQPRRHLRLLSMWRWSSGSFSLVLKCDSGKGGRQKHMAELPTGTVTFLFTDIEGSTKMWERDAPAMQVALARHDEILKRAIEERGGYVFKTVGDAFCAAFPTAPEALEAALEAQRALFFGEEWEGTGPLKVRMALHTGAAEERDGDYIGPPLNRVARLLSAGHGGQVLLSLPTQELVRDQLPREVGLSDLGERRLKDLFRPERVFQLVGSGLPSEFAPLRTLDAYRNNLPIQPTPLVGREKEVAEVCKRLSRPEVRLLTLTGAGGTGKTRLGLQAAAELTNEFEDGVFFVSLAAISDPELVVPAVAGTLGVKETGGVPLLESLKEYLREKRMLLVLDNFEQVLEAAPMVSELLSVAPNLKVLATSRIPLRLYGEHEYSVPPLALPDPERLPSVERLTYYEAVRLFVERAQAVKGDFSVTDQIAPAIAEICHRLDGLPLAIELAAARIKLLPPQAMLARLGNRLKLLTGGARDLPERQRTLRSTIEWSYGLLEEGEKTLFARLSVFAGGRTLEAIEAICNAEGDLPVDVLDGVSSLVDDNLLTQEEGVGGEPRFVMLETIHEYAREKLQESGQTEDLRRLHARYFLALTEEAEPELKGARQGEWLERLEEEHNNLRAALSWVLEREETELGLRLSGALGAFWYHRGYVREGHRWLEAALATKGDAPSVAARAKVLTWAAFLAWEEGDYERSQARGEEGLRLHRQLGDEKGAAEALHNLGLTALYQMEFERASAHLEEAAMLQRASGDAASLIRTLHALGLVAVVARHDHGQATALYEEGLMLARKKEDNYGILLSLILGALTSLDHNDHGRARALLEEGLELSGQHEMKTMIVFQLHLSASLAGAQRQPVRAARLWGAAEALREVLGLPFSPIQHFYYGPYIAHAHTSINEEAWETAWAEGRAMSLEEAVEYALSEEASPLSPKRLLAHAQPADLTRREEEVVVRVAQGLTNRQIAAELVISEHTAATHVRRILKKLSLKSRSQLSAWVAERELSQYDRG